VPYTREDRDTTWRRLRARPQPAENDHRFQKEAQMPITPMSELVEVWLWEPDAKREPFAHESRPLEYIPAAPLPRNGDIIHLPPNLTGDTTEQAFGYGGTRTPFRVMECSHVYSREKDEKLDVGSLMPAVYVKTLIFVERLSPKEFYDDRGWTREPGV
jgi:hypothetical protein